MPLSDTTLSPEHPASPTRPRPIRTTLAIVDGLLFYATLVFGMFLLSPGFLIFGVGWTLINHALNWGIKYAWMIIRSLS